MPKAPKSPGARDQRHNPLAEEYAPSDPFKAKPAKRQKRNKDDKADEQNYVDSKSSRKILEIGRELEEEDERENQARRPQEANAAFDFETRLGEDHVDSEDVIQHDDGEDAWGEDDDEVEEVELDANDLAAWNKFIPTDDNPIVWPGEEAQPSGPGTDLAALILEKIAAHEAGGGEVRQPEIQGGGAPEDAIELPAKVVEGMISPSHHLNNC
jgi:essential nuclear protein 1